MQPVSFASSLGRSMIVDRAALSPCGAAMMSASSQELRLTLMRETGRMGVYSLKVGWRGAGRRGTSPGNGCSVSDETERMLGAAQRDHFAQFALRKRSSV